MARKYPKPLSNRDLIPTFAMPKPWTDPTSTEEQAGMAQTAILAGAGDTNRAITTLLRDFAGDYVANLRSAAS